MSVIKKKPMVEVIVGLLSAEQIASLKVELDSPAFETYKSLINPHYFFDENDEIGAYRLELKENLVKNGIAIRLEGAEYFLAYDSTQRILIYRLNSAEKSFTFIDEYCDINELRRVVNDEAVGGETKPVKDLYAENVFATDEIELNGSSADFGSNAKAKIKEIALKLVEVDDAVVDGHQISFSLPNALKNSHILLMFECEPSGAHFGGDCVVHPKDADVCISAGVVDSTVAGSFENYTAVNNDGDITITLTETELASTDDIKIHYLVLY